MSDRHYAYTSKPKIIHSRDSSNDSHTSYSSGSSAEGHYSSSSSRSGMANGGYYEPSYREESRTHKDRTADDPRKYVESTTSRSGKNVVHHQNRVIYDEAAPKSREASSKHYQDTQKKEKSHKHRHH